MTPVFLYGTAWKEERTAALVRQALEVGFRAIDTANQRKHYAEQFVGDALKQAIDDGLVRRDEVFLQTKFTFIDGQDERLPYEKGAPVEKQVRQSMVSSLEHLQTDFVDSLVLHGPSSRSGWHRADRTAWQAMEALHDEGKAKQLGVSNVTLEQLQELVEGAAVQPAFVQNRCYARTGWNAEVRAFCRQHGIRYQGFSLLTANPQVLANAEVRAIAARHRMTCEQVVFAFAHRVGMLPLTGSSSAAHLRLDLASIRIELSDAEVATVEHAG